MYYFYSAKKSAFKVNGCFIGYTDNKIKRCDLKNTDFIEIIPLATYCLPVYFTVDNPSPYVKIIKYFNDFYIFVNNFPKHCFGYNKIHSSLHSVFNQTVKIDIIADGLIKIILDNSQYTAYNEIPFYPYNVLVKDYSVENNNYLLINVTGEKNLLLVYKIDTCITLVYENYVFLYDVDECLKTVINVNGYTKNSIEAVWNFDNPFTLKSVKVNRKEESCCDNKLLPITFCEVFKLGGNVSFLLGEEIEKNKDKLYAYIGKIDYAFPSPYKENQVLCVNDEIIFCLDFEISESKITNITKN